jgi:inner membrane protein
MFVFEHAGITLGVVMMLEGVLAKSDSRSTRLNELAEQPQASPRLPPSQKSSSVGIVSSLTSLAGRKDIRILLIGSLLPDIIDKPIGQLFFRETFSNGRIFCHTLLFLILITLVGLYLYWNRKRTWLLVLSFGTFTHLVLDLMWLTPRTLFWPLYGLSFERVDRSYLDMLYALLANPTLGIPELVGVAIVIWFISLLVHRRKLYAFIRNGRV